MMKTLKTGTISLLMLLVVIIMLSMLSCSKDSDIPNPKPDKGLIINSGDSLYEALNDGSVAVDVTSNKQFSYSINGGDWITPAQDVSVYDKGEHIQIQFNLQTLDLNAEKRTAQIVFTTTDKLETKTVFITQSGMIDVKTPGSLELEINKAGIKDVLTMPKLSLKGKLNSTDIICLRAMAGYGRKYGQSTDGRLSNLDISMVSFQIDPAIYYTDAGNNGFSIYTTDVVPALMFSNCSKLSMISLPISTKKILIAAFQYCTSLTNVTIPNNVTSIGKDTFMGCTSLANITIPSSVTSIMDGAFKACTSLVNITIPSSVASIMDGAFKACTSLSRVNMPNGLIRIAPYVFRSCTSLHNITIPEDVTIIDNAAFEGSGLASIVIPASVTKIGLNAFDSCAQLRDVTMKVIDPQYTSLNNIPFVSIAPSPYLHVPQEALTAYQNMGAYTYIFGKNIVPIQ